MLIIRINYYLVRCMLIICIYYYLVISVYSRLCVTDTHLVVLHEPAVHDGTARIHVERPLGTILRITSKKRQPEFITFKYGTNEQGQDIIVRAVDRFIIARAGEATKCIKQQIMKVLDAMET